MAELELQIFLILFNRGRPDTVDASLQVVGVFERPPLSRASTIRSAMVCPTPDRFSDSSAADALLTLTAAAHAAKVNPKPMIANINDLIMVVTPSQ